MEVTVLDNIPVNIDVSIALEYIKSTGTKNRAEALLRELMDIAMPIVRPKVVYGDAKVTAVDGRRLAVDGVEFSHHVHVLSFHEGERVFP